MGEKGKDEVIEEEDRHGQTYLAALSDTEFRGDLVRTSPDGTVAISKETSGTRRLSWFLRIMRISKIKRQTRSWWQGINSTSLPSETPLSKSTHFCASRASSQSNFNLRSEVTRMSEWRYLRVIIGQGERSTLPISKGKERQRANGKGIRSLNSRKGGNSNKISDGGDLEEWDDMTGPTWKKAIAGRFQESRVFINDVVEPYRSQLRGGEREDPKGSNVWQA